MNVDEMHLCGSAKNFHIFGSKTIEIEWSNGEDYETCLKEKR